MAKTNREQWRRRVAEWKRSGLPAREFAARAGLNAGTLSYWKWRLSREQNPVRETMIELPAVALDDERVEIELANGHRLRVPAGFDATVLGRVLSVLQERS